MIRIYCQHTIGGFKLFNISNFQHKHAGMSYVLVSEINEAQKAESQDLIVTNTQHNGLDAKIIFQFSSGAMSMMILGECGIDKNQTALFVSPIDSKLKFAFITDDKSELKVLAAMASMWMTPTGRTKLSRLLSELVSEPIIDNKQTFAFNMDKWDELIHILSGIKILPKFLPIEKGEKGFLVYNTPHKVKVLKESGINKPFSYFISMAGNEELRKTERNRRIAYIGISIGCCIAAASLALWVLKGLGCFSVEIKNQYHVDKTINIREKHGISQKNENDTIKGQDNIESTDVEDEIQMEDEHKEKMKHK